MPFENLLNISVKKDLVDYLSALLTPTVAVLGIVIAYRQWRTEEARRRHELFDRRNKQFDAVVKFAFSTMAISIKADDEFSTFDESNRLWAEISGMQFIFSPDIQQYVNDHIIGIHEEIQQLRSEWNMRKPGEERQKNAERQSKLKKNLRKNLEIFQEKTLKYMQLDQASSAKEIFKNLAALFEKIKNAAD